MIGLLTETRFADRYSVCCPTLGVLTDTRCADTLGALTDTRCAD